MNLFILFPAGAAVATLVAVLASGQLLVRSPVARPHRRVAKHALR